MRKPFYFNQFFFQVCHHYILKAINRTALFYLNQPGLQYYITIHLQEQISGIKWSVIETPVQIEDLCKSQLHSAKQTQISIVLSITYKKKKTFDGGVSL